MNASHLQINKLMCFRQNCRSSIKYIKKKSFWNFSIFFFFFCSVKQFKGLVRIGCFINGGGQNLEWEKTLLVSLEMFLRERICVENLKSRFLKFSELIAICVAAFNELRIVGFCHVFQISSLFFPRTSIMNSAIRFPIQISHSSSHVVTN